jgi:D-arabinose 1-dehydrogenase-like Zn-dependent alcohol dehydrogenase
VRAIRPGGEAVWIGLHEDESPFHSYDLILSERRLTGSYGATEADLKRAISLLAAKDVNTQGWLDLFPLEEGEAAFRAALRQELRGAKAVLCP